MKTILRFSLAPLFVYALTSSLVGLLVSMPASAAPACPASATAALVGATRLLVVTTAGWNDANAKLRLFERASGTDRWRSAGAAQPAVIGKSGLAWGYPFAASAVGSGEPVKHEGDGRTPGGIFKLGRKFGFEPSAASGYLALDPNTACVDDVSSRFYNTIVEENQVAKDWKSAEMMREIDLYKIGFVVDYPSDAKAQAGSCIFVHIWRAPGKGTSGCLASTESTIAGLQSWIKDSTPAAVVFLPAAKLGAWVDCIPGVAVEAGN